MQLRGCGLIMFVRGEDQNLSERRARTWVVRCVRIREKGGEELLRTIITV
jgi:hypothetical protein